MARSGAIIQFGGANSGSLASGGTLTSDAVALPANAYSISVQVKITTSANAPGADDFVIVYAQFQTTNLAVWDSDQAAQSTEIGAIAIGQVLTNGSSPAANHVAIKTMRLPQEAPASFRLHLDRSGSNTDTWTVEAAIEYLTF